jgi:hypothetical protein
MRIYLIIIFTNIFLGNIASAQNSKKQSVEVVYEDNSKEDKTDEEFSEPIEQLFKNPALANGIASGSDAINRSIESLMDSLFYSALDNELKWNLTEESVFATGFRRDLYSTQSGAYVVVDRMSLGPRFSKPLGNVANLPISLGADGSVEVLQIYLRTDGMRVAEQAELPFWRKAVNNWFGFLPLASLMLPPSFNPNELYDPLKQLETPFVFPLTVEKFKKMPIGSIRSYNVSGGISLSMNFSGAIDKNTGKLFKSLENITGSAPYSVFKTGESRINVLRRGNDIAWVGLAKTNRTGHSFGLDLGNRIYVLTGALAATAMDNKWKWVWQGVPGLFYPLDSSYEEAFADIFDQVYEYDLTIKSAQEAYIAAVNGDFTLSQIRYRESRESNSKTGVVFQFTRDQDRTENISKNGPNWGVFKNSRKKDVRKSEIEITDQEGKFYILEARESIQDRNWDVLVGDEKEKLTQILEIKVQKLISKEFASTISDPEALVFDEELTNEDLDEDTFFKVPMDGSDKDEIDIDIDEDEEVEKFYYVLSTKKDPLRVTLKYDIQDRYTTAEEYSNYLEELRYVTNLPIRDIPKIDFRDNVLLRDRRIAGYFRRPEDASTSLHVVPTYLGQFSAKASIVIDTKELRGILNKTDDQLWTAFAKTFSMDYKSWGRGAYRDTLSFQKRWFGAFLAIPLKLFNVRFRNVDAISEIYHRIDAIKRLREAKRPLDMLDISYELFDTNYPRELMRTLLMLTNRSNVPRKVSIAAKPKGGARHVLKKKFRKANGRVFTAGPNFPRPDRYARAKKKLAAFYLDQPRERVNKPLLRKLHISTKNLPRKFKFEDGTDKSEIQKQRGKRHAFINFSVQNTSPNGPLQVYVRVEQAGKIKFGKLELSERVLKLRPLNSKKSKLSVMEYEFYLSGPNSPMSNFVYDKVVDLGDEFAVTITVSREGLIWSDSKTFEYSLEDGILTKTK